MPTPIVAKDAETIIRDRLDLLNALTGGVSEDRVRSALASYAAHILSVLPKGIDPGERGLPLGDDHFVSSVGYNAAIESCRSAILKEAGITEGV